MLKKLEEEASKVASLKGGLPSLRPIDANNKGGRVTVASVDLTFGNARLYAPSSTDTSVVSAAPPASENRAFVWKHGVTLPQEAATASGHGYLHRHSAPKDNRHPAAVTPRYLQSDKRSDLVQSKTGSQLRQDLASAPQGELVLLGNGHYERLPAAGSEIWLQREAFWEAAQIKMGRSLRHNPLVFKALLHGFAKYEGLNTVQGMPKECVTMSQFEDALRGTNFKLTIQELKEVARRVDERQTNRIKYVEAVDSIRASVSKYTDPRRNPSSKSQPQAAAAPNTQAAARDPNSPGSPYAEGEKGAAATGKGGSGAGTAWGGGAAAAGSSTVPFAVFVIGFLVCPVWCLAWGWCRFGSTRAQFWGRLSIFLATVWLIVGVVVGVIVALQRDPTREISAAHCPVESGVVAAVKVSGPSASESFFWDRTASPPDFSAQLRMRSGIEALCTKQIIAPLMVDDCNVLLDGINTIFNDADGATLVVSFKITTKGKDAAGVMKQLLASWIDNGLLKQALEVYRIFFDSIRLYDAAPTYQLGPPSSISVYQQSRVFWNAGTPGWTSTMATGLYRHLPIRANIMDPKDPLMIPFQQRYLKTCWLVNLVQASALRVDTTTTVRVGKRTLQVLLRTNQTSEEFGLWVRKAPSEAVIDLTNLILSNVPVPTWLMDNSGAVDAAKRAIPGVPFRDVDNCQGKQVVDIGLCPLSYLVETEVDWTGRSYYWIGVTGVSADAQYLPFEILNRLVDN